MFKVKKGSKLITAVMCILLCGVLAACGGEPFEDLEWDDEIYLSDDALILEPGEQETFSVDNFDSLKNLKMEIDKDNGVADIVQGEDYEFTVTAKTEGERVVTFFASYCSSVRFKIIVAKDTDKAWDKFYEEQEALEEEEDDWDDDWDDEDWDDEDWEEDEFDYDPANYETPEWNEMFDEGDVGETVESRVYNLNVHLEGEDIATFIMADYLDTEPVDLPMANSSFTINKDGTFTMVIDNDEIRNSYTTYINNMFETILLSEAISYGYTGIEELADSEGFENVDELRADRLETLVEDMNDQWPEDVTGVITYTGYVEKDGEDLYLYDVEGNDLFDSVEMLEDGSVNIVVFSDDDFNPIATDHTWIWR
ncbi:MAG: hypothetical protein K5686_05480 [Lachnospiraceae bacterium]|nr:hypothetical protein [Lachnospiraceae bacterium]